MKNNNWKFKGFTTEGDAEVVINHLGSYLVTFQFRRPFELLRAGKWEDKYQSPVSNVAFVDWPDARAWLNDNYPNGPPKKETPQA